MKKEVKLEDERTIRIEVNDTCSKITETFSADGIECARYSLVYDNKFYFQAEVEPSIQTASHMKNISFIIDINHPLYFAFIHLLKDKDEVLLKENDNDLKYFGIKKDGDIITLSFVDKILRERSKDKHRIEYDSTLNYISNKESIEKNALKQRLKTFFAESSDLLLEGSRQISFEEYTLSKRIAN